MEKKSNYFFKNKFNHVKVRIHFFIFYSILYIIIKQNINIIFLILYITNKYNFILFLSFFSVAVTQYFLRVINGPGTSLSKLW